MAEDKYFKQVKCPDCTWSQYQDSEPCAMTPCDRCNSTGYILVPVDEPKTEPNIEELNASAKPMIKAEELRAGFTPLGKAVEPPTDRAEVVNKLLLAYYQADYYPNIRDDYAKEICSLFKGGENC